MLRRPPRSTRTDTPFPSRLSADCARGQRLEASKVVRQVPRQRVAAADGALAVERSDTADPQCRTDTRHRHARLLYRIRHDAIAPAITTPPAPFSPAAGRRHAWPCRTN